eukprot:2560957-Rhodomonas_salina.1
MQPRVRTQKPDMKSQNKPRHTSSRAKSHGQAVPLVSGDLAAPDSNALAPSAAMRKLVAADAERMVLPPINESSDSMPPSRPPAGAM